MSFRKLIIPIFIGLFNIALLVFPREVLNAAREGLLLWFHTILPSLLPFAIGINLFIKLGFMRFVGEFIAPLTKKLFSVSGSGGVAFITGITSGYPIGAKTVGDMYRAGDIKPKEAQRLMVFCNNAGPLFIVGAVGMGMFGDSKAGYTLLAGHILGAVFMGVGGRLFGGYVKEATEKNHTPKKIQHNGSFGKTLGESVKNAMEAMVMVGGFIILFRVVVALLQILLGLDVGYTEGFLGGLFEIAGGVKGISTGGVNTLSLALAAFVIGFGGLSVHAQALHFISGTGVRAGLYILHKTLHGVISAGLTVIVWHFYPS
jgi:sporulation integral membrane protein YlbJ